MTILIARFDVSGYDPSTIPGIDDDWVGALVMRKTYTEGIVGEGLLHFISSGVEGAQGYLAAERITGSIDGADGAVTVHHGALNSSDDPTAFGHIIPGTGTGAFDGWTGTARIVHDDRGPYFVFELS
jgi:hypothetical protein